MQKTPSPLSNRTLVSLLVFVFFMLWLPRAFALDTFVYVDEPSWMQRSANFYYALRHREFNRTFQNLTPGVTTMWAGTVAFLIEYPGYATEAPGYFGEQPTKNPDFPYQYSHKYDHLEAFLLSRGVDPLDILAASRAVTVLLISIVLTFAFYFAQRLFGTWPSLVAFGLLSFEPYFLVNSRFAHLDGPMGAFLLLSLLAFLNYVHLDRQQTFALAVSALAGSAAWLSKQQGILILPTMVVILVFHAVDLRPGVQWKARLRSIGNLRRHIKPLVLWGILFLLGMVVLWPAMWQSPLRLLNALLVHPIRFLFSSTGSAVSPQEAVEAFGEIGEGAVPLGRDWLFYPRSFLWLTTPLTVIGLLLGLAAYLRRWNVLGSGRFRQAYAALWVFSVIFTLSIALSLKVAERYYLPVYLVMAVLAGLGWYSAAARLGARMQPQRARYLAPGLLALALAGQMLSSLPLYPYYVPYHNLLLGGNARAGQLRYNGFGEGLNLAAEYLNQQPDAEDLNVVSWYANGPFSSYFVGHAYDVQALTRNMAALSVADYLVTYRNSWDRDYLAAYFAVLDSVEPEHTVELFGVAYARIYAVSDLPPELFEMELLP